MPRPALRHLAAAGIPHAEEQDFLHGNITVLRNIIVNINNNEIIIKRINILPGFENSRM
jgi:hypothetical protein